MATSPSRGWDDEPFTHRIPQPCTDFVATRAATHISASGNEVVMLTDPRLATRHYADYSVVKLHGEFDVASRDSLSDELHEAMNRCHGRSVLVDLAGVEFMDCTVLGVLINAHRNANRRGLRMVLVSPAKSVQKLLDITHIDRTLPTKPHLQAALNASTTRMSF